MQNKTTDDQWAGAVCKTMAGEQFSSTCYLLFRDSHDVVDAGLVGMGIEHDEMKDEVR